MPDSQDETAIALLNAARKLESETDDFGYQDSLTGDRAPSPGCFFRCETLKAWTGGASQNGSGFDSKLWRTAQHYNRHPRRLSETAKAIRYVEQGHVRGKVVIAV